MCRVLAIAVAGVGLTSSLCGCSSFSVGAVTDYFKSTPPPLQVQIESTPPGADAKTSLGPGCKTPCSVSVSPADNTFTVTYTLNRFEQATVPVSVTRNPGDFTYPATTTVDPNPVVAELQPSVPQKGNNGTKLKAVKSKRAAAPDTASPSSEPSAPAASANQPLTAFASAKEARLWFAQDFFATTVPSRSCAAHCDGFPSCLDCAMAAAAEDLAYMNGPVSNALSPLPQPMVDPFGRTISYLRVSVTDRCDLRCFYCMSEDMTFLPKADLLTLEELDRLCSAFIAKGVRKLRLTGGEPLVRRNVMSLVRSLSRHLRTGALRELTMTTNGTQLSRFAAELADCGIRRINVSLDTLDATKFRAITRWGELDKVLAGIEAARGAGLAVKINAVALKNLNEDEITSLIQWAHGNGMVLTLIEVMPMGEIGQGRIDQYVPLSLVRARLAKQFTLTDLDETTGGPARYVRVAETGGTLGFITPLTHNFCESCNRVRITCTGTIHTCLGQEDASDLRKPLRASLDDALLSQAIDRAIATKPKGHDFIIDRRHNRPSVRRHMSVTGG